MDNSKFQPKKSAGSTQTRDSKLAILIDASPKEPHVLGEVRSVLLRYRCHNLSRIGNQCTAGGRYMKCEYTAVEK